MNGKKVVKLREEILRWEAKTAELQQRREPASLRMVDLEYQRSQQVLAALTEDNPAAKEQLEKLSLEVGRAQRHFADLVLACEQAGDRVDGLRQELAEAERTENEEALLRLLKQREGIGHEMARLLEEHVLPLLHQASGLNDEMGKLASGLGLDYSLRAPAFTDLLAYSGWRVLQDFPVKYSLFHPTEPIEGRAFRPPDLSLAPGLALVAHDKQFRRRLLKEIEDKRQAAAASVVAAT